MKKTILKNILIFSSILFIDQFSKYLIRAQGGFYICNKNISFSLVIPQSILPTLLALIIFALLFILFKFQPKLSVLEKISLIFILSGAISNILDRLLFGCVIDFINLGFWPSFNLADAFISSGAIILIIQTLTHTTSSKKK